MTGIASRSQLRMSFLRYALFTVPLVLLLGTVSGRIGGSGDGNPWFDSLVKPAFMPPDFLYGIVWANLHVLLGLSLAMILHARGALGRRPAILVFTLLLMLAFAWPPVFFAWHAVGLALAVIAAMILLTLLLAVLAWRIRRVAAFLLLPWLAWIGFVAVLTWEIGRLNPRAELAPRPAATDIVL